ncbi:MAG TPA: hypothetical protein VGN12_04785 [Pirellulales bacterium]|jgi:hypothetical protein
MNELDLLRQLGQRADAEAVPAIDVGGRVIQRLAHPRARSVDPRLSLVSACACLLAALAILITWPAYADNDSLSALSEAASNSTGPEALLKVLEP